MKTKKNIDVSIIVTARNYEQYIWQCLFSCAAQQTKLSFEIIYSDDYSTDSSVDVVTEMSQNLSIPITIRTQDRHVGVAKARDQAASLATGKYFVFVDGDDKLPDNYITELYKAMEANPEAPFAYVPAQEFGTSTKFWDIPDWKDRFIWQRNFVNTSCMMRATAYYAAGGWQPTIGDTLWDWHMAIRLSKTTTADPIPVRTTALAYRRHDDSWSRQKRKTMEEYMTYVRQFRNCYARLGIGMVYGGRMSGLLRQWLQCLHNDICELEMNSQNKKSPVKLIIRDNSKSKTLWAVLDYVGTYGKTILDIEIVKGQPLETYETERERKFAVAELLATSYNKVLDRLQDCDLIHLREDDMLTEPGTFMRMWNFIIDIEKDRNRAAVGALYRNRHANRIVGGTYNEKAPRRSKSINTPQFRTKPIPVHYTGTGCLLFWREQCPETFEPTIGRIPAHDWNWGVRLNKERKRLYILPDAVCRHYVNIEFKYVVPGQEEPIITYLNHTKLKN